ncbi:MAG: hypothetical protein H6603_11090 [Flavobacteriales bacterium]|nr:hypothetical protein [Flavobacteriales bacterium]
MKNLQSVILFIAMLALSLPVLGQKKKPDNFTVLKERKARKDISGMVNRTRDHVNGFSVGIGMHMSFMQSPSFGELIKKKELKHDLRFATAFSSVGVRAIVMPYIIDVSAFSSVPFQYEPGIVVNDSLVTHFRHQGMDVSFSMAAITFSRIIYPYMGVGYSFSRIGSGKKLTTDKLVMANTSALFWKVGVAIHPVYFLFVTAEYASTINGIGNSTQRGFGTFDLSLRYTLADFKKGKRRRR